MDWFLYDRDFRYEGINYFQSFLIHWCRLTLRNYDEYNLVNIG